MNDTDVLLAIILRFGVNIDYFVVWYHSVVNPTYLNYVNRYNCSFENDDLPFLSSKCLDEFSFLFLVGALTWKGVL